MESEKISKDKNKDIQNDKFNVNLKNVKSNYILSKINANLSKRTSLQVVKYNKILQKRLNLNIKDYKKFCDIEIEISPCKCKKGKFININENDEIFYHIYFNDSKEETKKII